MRTLLPRCLFVMILASVAASISAAEESWPDLTERQADLLELFRTLRPHVADPGGVWMLETWNSDEGLERLVAIPTASGNAAAHFKRMEELFQAEKDVLGGGETSGERELLAAAELANCRLSPDYYPEFDRADAKQPDYLVLRLYLKFLLETADRLERDMGDVAGAEKRFQAALLCGRHLTRDRSTRVVYLTGVFFKLRAAQAYEQFLRRQGKIDKADAAKTYADRLAELLQLFYWKSNQGLGVFDDFASLPVALEVARNDREPCWRAEAVLHLAVFRHGAPNRNAKEMRRNPEWEKAAEQALSEVAAGDPAPAIRRLAVWSVLNIKPDMFSNMRHLF